MQTNLSPIGVATALSVLLLCVGCGGGGVTHGIAESGSEAAFWVAIDGDVRYMLVVAKPLESTPHENWDQTEFNVFYELRYPDRRRELIVLVYGDINEGIITASYDGDPLNLAQGRFLAFRGERQTPLTAAEKDRWLSQIRP